MSNRTEANRVNALQSTGPRTPAGKAIVSANALKHGLLSRESLLPDEDSQALAQLAESLHAQLQPAGEIEALLVDRITMSVWRLRRLGRVEAGIFTREIYQDLANRAQTEANSCVEFIHQFDDMTTIADQKKHQAALDQAEAMRKIRDSEAATIGQAFITAGAGADAFSKLSRYEAAIERSMYRALHELQRLQATRDGQAVPLPAVIDVDVSGDNGFVS